MEIEYKGGNCVVISRKKDEIVVDPGIRGLGLKDQGSKAAVHLLTHSRFAAPVGPDTMVFDGPGEYEVNNCSIKGVAASEHINPAGVKSATIYRLDSEELSVVVLGYIGHELLDEQIEAIGVVDVLVLPVGGHGYTLEPKQAVDITRAIEPKIVIPTHYAEEGVNYEVPQLLIDDFLKELGISAEEPVTKLKLKAGQLPEKLTVYQLLRTK